VEAAETEAVEAEAAEAAEVEGCIRSGGMHWKSTEADGADRADRDSSEYKVSEAVKTIRTCQNLLGQDGTCLGILLLLVGPNCDGFGGQAFMGHYSGVPRAEWSCTQLMQEPLVNFP
jgi:hypothetical protein